MDPLLQQNFIYVFALIFCISFYEILTSLSRSYLDAITPVILNEFFLKIYTLTILIFHGFKYIDFSTFLITICFWIFNKIIYSFNYKF